MKKFLSILLALVLILPVLVGCQNSAPALQIPNGNALAAQIDKAPDPEASSPVATEDTAAPAAIETKITREKALEIALEHAGLKASQVRDLEVELDKDGGNTHYDVEFEYSDYDYDYEIDAQSGKILKSRKEKD